MPPTIPDSEPQEVKLRQRRQKIEATPVEPAMDAKETAEREEAAQAYAGEDESHFVRFLDDMVKLSVDSMIMIRQEQQECWDVYMEKEPPNFAWKENWQSRVVVPKPFSTVQFFLALVRKAFDPQFLSIENEQNEDARDDWRKIMELQLSRTYSNFPINFVDATGMGAAVGQSMEMIPVWRSGRGLEWILIEPWKIHRDPDSLSRRPQSGMYWIHQEWCDFYDLKDKEGTRYQNIPDFGPGGLWGNPKDTNLQKEEIQRRKDMLWQRSAFRSLILTSEYWGTVLDKGGRLLLPKATFTVAGDRVIGLPKESPYPSLRWPGTGFSPLPHLLRYDGRSLVQGIKSLWYFMCSLMALHADALNWIVNPPTEIDISVLVDQDNLDDYPGKLYTTRGSASGQQAVRTVDRKSQTGDILANLNFADQRYQEGSMINYAAQGLPGYRAEITAKEAAQNLEQSMTIVGLMGENLEDGALNAIIAAAETIRINMTYEELGAMLPDLAEKYHDASSPTRLKLPDLTTGAWKVMGVSTQLRNQEIINGITNMVLPLLEPKKFGNMFAPYMKPYQLLRSIERRLDLKDEKIIVTADEARAIDERQQQAQEAQIEQERHEREAKVAGAKNLALKHGAHADKAHGEADSKRAQGELYKAQAGALQQPPGAEPGAEGTVQ